MVACIGKGGYGGHGGHGGKSFGTPKMKYILYSNTL